MSNFEIRKRIKERYKQQPICAGYESIARWLLREHNVIATASWIERVIRDE